MQRIHTEPPTIPPMTQYQDLTYTYDANRNALTILDALASQTQTFTYDALDRLWTAQTTGGTGGAYGPESYTYNAGTGNLDSKAGVSYTYGTQSASCPDGALSKPHAVVTAGSNSYCYDRNGNQVKRSLGGSVYTLSYDAENRLTSVSGAASASFVYDGDGRQVEATVGGVTTVYVGDYYEWTSAGNTKYYFAGGQRVAMRRTGYGAENGLFLSFADHLGSTSLRVAESGGSRLAELRFKAWGETRYTYGSMLTKDQFTGQRNEMAQIGLYFYNARWYDPSLGRFAQADSIVPGAGNSMALDRYAYTLNNPIRYIDPSGHDVCDEDCNCYGRYRTYQAPKTGTPIYYVGVGFSEDDVKILIVLIAMESSSGKVPDNVNYMKAWALLNLRSYHQASGMRYYCSLTPFEDWKNHEGPLLEMQEIFGTTAGQVIELLAKYEKYASGMSPSMTTERFEKIVAQVNQAGREWYTHGSNSMADPVHGATGFIDARGLKYPGGIDTDPLLGEIPSYEELMTDYIEMEQFRNIFTPPLVVSQVYKLGTLYNFIVFHGPFVK